MPDLEPFGERGSELHAELVKVKSWNPAELTLIVEACRIADLLEEMAGVIHGKGVINLMHLRHMDPSDDTEITMTVDGVVAEVRQQQLAFQRIVAALKLESGIASAAKGDVGDDLAAQRARRIAAATGS